MSLEFIIYLSILISSIYLTSRYVMYNRRPLSQESPMVDKLLYGTAYGMIGIGIMYVHHLFSGTGYSDPRKIAILLPFFYGGWLPALISSLLIFWVRASLLTVGADLPLLALSLICTLIITYLVTQSNMNRSKQWYAPLF